eukprot:4368745-Pyramimonas_sp.AAC.1
MHVGTPTGAFGRAPCVTTKRVGDVTKLRTRGGHRQGWEEGGEGGEEGGGGGRGGTGASVA